MTYKTSILNELGAAYRGDWSDVYGRSIRDELDMIAVWIDDENDSRSIVDMRTVLGVCPKGLGHWVDYCDKDCKD